MIRMSLFCLRTKSCLLLFTFISGLCCIVFLWSAQQSNAGASWNTIVSKTQQHFLDLNENPQRYKATDADPYLKKLGFFEDLSKKQSTSPFFGDISTKNDAEENRDGSKIEAGNRKNRQKNEQLTEINENLSHILTEEEAGRVLPAIVVPVLRNQGASAGELLASIRSILGLNDFNVIFYDLGLGYYEKQDLQFLCANFSSSSNSPSNSNSGPACQIRQLEVDKYPSHVYQLKYDVYRPIIIQETLQTIGAVFYLTPNHRFVAKIPEKRVLDKTRKLGVAGWGLTDSTSSMTHQKTFAFFHTDPQSYYFHRTIRGDRFFIYNTLDIRNRLMLPWLQCSLTYRCVAPMGAQDTGCNLNRRPLYLYSGCHYYDWSVFNVVLGLLFKFNTESYIVNNSRLDNSSFLIEKINE